MKFKFTSVILGLSLSAVLSYGAGLENVVRHIDGHSTLLNLHAHGIEKWSKSVSGKLEDWVQNKNAQGIAGVKLSKNDSGIVFFGSPNVKGHSDDVLGNWRSDGYGVIGAKSENTAPVILTQYPKPDGGVVEVEMKGLFSSLNNRVTTEVKSGVMLERNQKISDAVMTVDVKSTDAGQVVSGVEGASYIESFVARRPDEKTAANLTKKLNLDPKYDNIFITKRDSFSVRQGDKSVKVETGWKNDPPSATIGEGIMSYKVELPSKIKGDIVNLEAKINGEVTVEIMDSTGNIHRTVYQVTKTDQPLLPASERPKGYQLTQFKAVAKPIDTAFVEDGYKKLVSNVKTYSGPTSVPAKGSVQGIRLNTNSGAQ